MSKTHWKKLTNPDYLGSYALDEGQGLTVIIDYVRREMVTGPDGKKEECTVAHFKDRNVKPMILNVTNCKIITKLYKTPYIEDWSGRAITIRSEEIKAFGDVVEALRVKKTVPKISVPSTKSYLCSDCGEELTAFNGKSADWLAQYTQDKYGKVLCSECAKKAAEDKTVNKASELAGALEGVIDDENN